MEEKESIFSDIETLKVVEASRTQQFIANITDAIIQLVIILLLYKFLPSEIVYAVLSVSKFMYYLVFFIWVWLYRSLLILSMGKTIGMGIAGIKFLNKNLQPPSSAKEKFLAIIAPNMNGIKTYKN